MIQICADCAASGISQQVYPHIDRCACCGLVAPLTITSRTWSETQEDFRARAFAAIEAHEAALVEVAPVEVEAPSVPAKGRCPHYAVIREFAALARENGLSMKDADRARGAMGVYLGVKINSRADLSPAQWRNAITGLRAGVLFW